MSEAVIVYSRTGNTRRLAARIAATTGGAVIPLEATGVPGGPLALVVLGFLTLIGWRAQVRPATPLPPDLTRVVLAAPVWAGRVAYPMRAWLDTRPALPAARAVAMTGGNPEGPGKALAAFAALAGAPADTALYVAEGAIDDPALDRRIAATLAGVP